MSLDKFTIVDATINGVIYFFKKKDDYKNKKNIAYLRRFLSSNGCQAIHMGDSSDSVYLGNSNSVFKGMLDNFLTPVT